MEVGREKGGGIILQIGPTAGGMTGKLPSAAAASSRRICFGLKREAPLSASELWRDSPRWSAIPWWPAAVASIAPRASAAPSAARVERTTLWMQELPQSTRWALAFPSFAMNLPKIILQLNRGCGSLNCINTT